MTVILSGLRTQDIAFTSTRDGGMDLFTLPVTGGTPTRLTTFTGAVYPECFTPDGKRILYRSSVAPDQKYGQFPSGSQIYSIPVNAAARNNSWLSKPTTSISIKQATKSFTTTAKAMKMNGGNTTLRLYAATSGCTTWKTEISLI